MEEEIFGPVLTIQSFENEEEALALADHDVYGLAAGVHTADLGRALRTVRKTRQARYGLTVTVAVTITFCPLAVTSAPGWAGILAVRPLTPACSIRAY
ncbi:hypothetical protein HORIV_63990 [Vreelandella olivaria]|uniref:Aldehyde dehydrogenase domain-containing protein n=1 Tax=Vreelandella olivaria TaxID=390919 RepID=A0ABM7GTG7_9GAMM|nr:hypothetical protein HORIV_63990 [Halomonas olivaria]